MLQNLENTQTHFNNKEESNSILEIEDQVFKPHFGNNLMFRFRNGQPQITIGPHWPLSLCVIIGILIGTYVICCTIYARNGVSYCMGSIASAVLLEYYFLRTFLKNPGVNFTLTNVVRQENSCFPCKLVKQQGTHHCHDCDICVRGYDHHCPWVGKCIGEGNMSDFQMFLVSFLFYFLINLLLVMI